MMAYLSFSQMPYGDPMTNNKDENCKSTTKDNEHPSEDNPNWFAKAGLKLGCIKKK